MQLCRTTKGISALKIIEIISLAHVFACTLIPQNSRNGELH